MKYLLSVIILIGHLPNVTAQSARSRGDQLAKLAERVHVDSSHMECIYTYTVYDPAYDETREDFKILEIGKKNSKYGDYGAYQQDSLILVDYPNGITKNEHTKIAKRLLPSWEATIKDFSTGSMRTYDSVFIDEYVYEEPISLMKWTIAAGTENICGYTCRKATTSFRGRKWIVWYTPEIPIENGPWKFGGLPGLILKAESDDNEQKFEAVSIRENNRHIQLIKFNYQKTTREKYNQERKEYCNNPRQFLSGNILAPKDKDGNIAVAEFRRLFYNPIELK